MDPLGSALTAVPGAVTFSDAARVPHAGILRFVPRDPLDLDAYGAVYEELRARVLEAVRAGKPEGAHCWIWCDEAGYVMPANRAPRAATAVVIAGRKLSIGHLSCHPRPREVARCCISTAQHIAAGPLTLEEDRKEISRLAGIPYAELQASLAGLPEHGFVWCDQRRHSLTVCEL